MYHLFLAAAVSGGFQDLAALEERILAIAPAAGSIDRRLKLAECPGDPVIEQPTNGAIIVRCPSLGWRLRVPVYVRTGAMERTEIMVRKGEMVECESGGPGFSVSVTMIALEDAGVGQAVRVKSPTSSIPVTAVVKARGLVSL